MKRMLAMLLVCLILAGCGAPAATTPEPEVTPPQEQTAEPRPEPAPEEPEEATQEQEALQPQEEEEEETIPVLEVVYDDQTPMLQNLMVDGTPIEGFDPACRTYEVLIPAGRPHVPQVSAEAEAEISVCQAVIPDSTCYGTAHISLTDASGSTGEYAVRFVKDASQGFQLQYQDRWQYQPEVELKEGECLTYQSSNTRVIQVSEDGTLHAVGLSGTPITVDALLGDTVVDTLTIDRVVDAVVNLFLITGQSNASGTLDIPAGMSEAAYTMKEMKDVLCPEPGTAFCIDIDFIGGVQKTMYDLSEGRIGFSPALAKTWYELTGEKVLVLQTAAGGSPIESWLKPTDGVRNTYLFAQANFYETTVKGYQYCKNSIGYAGSGYEINHTFAYWLQGETGTTSTYNPNKIAVGVGDWDFGSQEHIVSAPEYYDMFLQNMEYFRNELNVEFMGILMVRNLEDSSTPESIATQLLTDLSGPRAAQYALNNTGITDIGLVSLVSEYARKETWSDKTVEGWGFMGCNNVHYNQEGHNANGVAAAENTFMRLYGWNDRVAETLVWYQENGRDVFSDGDVLELKAGAAYQTSAIALPMYTDTSAVAYASSDVAVCSIDNLGTIYAVGAQGSSAELTLTCPGTELSITITVKIVG